MRRRLRVRTAGLTLAGLSCGHPRGVRDRHGGRSATDQQHQDLCAPNVRGGRSNASRKSERTVVRWWQLAQYRAAAESLRLFSCDARAKLERAGYATLLVRYLGPWLQTGRPRVERVEHPGRGRALVFLRLRFKTPVGHDLAHESDGFLAMTLRHEGPDWLISDPSWVLGEGFDTLRAAMRRRDNGPIQ